MPRPLTLIGATALAAAGALALSACGHSPATSGASPRGAPDAAPDIAHTTMHHRSGQPTEGGRTTYPRTGAPIFAQASGGAVDPDGKLVLTVGVFQGAQKPEVAHIVFDNAPVDGTTCDQFVAYPANVNVPAGANSFTITIQAADADSLAHLSGSAFLPVHFWITFVSKTDPLDRAEAGFIVLNPKHAMHGH